MYKDYKVKIKMLQEQWLQLKMKFLLGYNMKTGREVDGEINNKYLVGAGPILAV